MDSCTVSNSVIDDMLFGGRTSLNPDEISFTYNSVLCLDEPMEFGSGELGIGLLRKTPISDSGSTSP